MSIFPATDMIVDVARAADPGRRDIAMRRLAEASDAPAPDWALFANMALGGTSRAPAGLARTRTAAASVGPTASAAVTPSASETGNPAVDAFRKFEALILQTFIEALLPKEDSGLYGQGTAGGLWRSMMAEQVGTRITQAGGIGLRKVFEKHLPSTANAAADAPAATS